MAAKNDLRPVFERLKEIFAPYEPKMDIAQNTDNMYVLNTRHLLKKNYPLMFGGVRLGKNYVSYHLMTIYGDLAQSTTVSPELKKRMQGKTCFNFTAIDEPLFRELAKITKDGAKRFSDEKVIEGLRRVQADASAARKRKRIS
jgi:hypothetical protein